MTDPQATNWFDDLTEGVVMLADERVVALNEAAANLLGVERDKAVGLPAIAVLRDHRLEEAWRTNARCEIRLRGRTVIAKGSGDALVLEDVSSVREAHEGARDLLAVLSHELRTPVTTVRSTLEALAYEDLEPDQRTRFIRRAEEEADRLVRLLEDLTVDVRPPRERSVELGPVVERACTVLANRLAERRVEVIADVAPYTVWADPDKVMQVLVNLIENAAIHGPSDATIEVQARQEADVIEVCVRDHGDPLDEARVEQLFEPHARGAGVNAKGVGLGLYVVRSIAERWGGRAWGRAWRDGDGSPAGNEFGVSVPPRRSSSGVPVDDAETPQEGVVETSPNS